MKKSHIFGIVIIAVAIIVIISTAGDASSYVSFKEAKELAEKGNGNKIHVVGSLKKNELGKVTGIHPSPDMLSMKFEMVDEDNFTQTVFYPNPMPTDFMRSEQVVVIGSYKNENFIAEKILLKCPSKYQEEGKPITASIN